MKIEKWDNGLMLEEDDWDLDDFIIHGLYRTVGKLHLLSGVDNPKVRLEGVDIEIGEQDPRQQWRERLNLILEQVDYLIQNTDNLTREDICRELLELDGWSWTVDTFRTPIWMNNFQEFDRDMLAEEIEELAWIGISSSGIK